MSFSVGMEEFDDAPPRPLVSNSEGSPVKDDGCCGDGEKVLTRVTDLNRKTILDQVDRKVVCNCMKEKGGDRGGSDGEWKREERRVGEGRESRGEWRRTVSIIYVQYSFLHARTHTLNNRNLRVIKQQHSLISVHTFNGHGGKLRANKGRS